MADKIISKSVTPRIRCARFLPVIRCRCHVICLRVAFCHVIICISYHVIMCIAFAYVFVSCIRAFSPLSVLQSGTPMSPGAPFVSFHVRVLNVLGMGRYLPSGLAIALTNRPSNFVAFGVRLIAQPLTHSGIVTVPSSDVSVSVTVAGSLPLLSHSPSPVL